MPNENAKRFINRVVRGYMLKDLENLLRIPVVPNADGNCNFPIVLFVFSCMDFLGYLVSVEKLDDLGDTGRRIRAYVDLAFMSEDKKKLEPYLDHLVRIFRHGLSHEFFPKSSGISRLEAEVISNQQGKLVLDADRFAEMFQRSVDELERFAYQTVTGELILTRYAEKQKENEEYFAKVFPSLNIPDKAFISTATVSLNVGEIKNLP